VGCAEPLISQVSLEDADKIENNGEVRITGSGFGSKAHASPVLFDFASHAYEKGKLNIAHSLLKGTSSLPLGHNGEANAVWSTSSSSFYYSDNAQPRHPYSEGTYFLDGANAWVGRPVAYGGLEGWGTPADNPQAYVSWWYKNKYDSVYYWRFSELNQSGTFIPGEPLRIDGAGSGYDTGTYIGVDNEGLHNAVLYGHRNKNYLVLKRIVGVKSGASTVFPDTFRAGSGEGYETPGSKLMRVWDDPNGSAGIRSSVALHDFYVSPQRDGFDRAKVYATLDLPDNEWVHLEYELDTNAGVVRLFEDGELQGEANFSPDAAYQGKYSPTIALIGTNAHQLKLQKSWISEIYFDDSLQRVVLGNAENYGDVTHRELQLPVSWNDSEINLKLNLGALDFNDDVYLYVFDKDGVSNKKGYPLCSGDSCPVPPSRINLLIN
tara:strand:- start:11532 stop:12836 length:1305 start_codon:yes stop_codon:yes gene_type:complete